MDTTLFPTLLDQLKIDRGIGSDIVAEAITQGFRPEMTFIPADTIHGTSIELTVLTGLPTIGFRNLNEGTAGSKANWETRVFQTGIIDQPIQADRRSADTSKDRGRFLAAQTMPFLEAALNHVARQFWYGTTNDAKGFIGLIAQASSASTHNYDVTGSSVKSSVWFLKTGMGNVQWIFGNDGYITMADWKEETLYDADGQAFPGLSNWVKGRPGLRLANKNSAVRIKNIGTANGKTLTDAHMHAGLKLCTDLGMQPDLIIMNSRSREQLRASRTATNATGAPAPIPVDFEGLPIRVSSFISNDETI